MGVKVSICIPQYNRCEMLRQVIHDLISQTYTNFELIICDDASTDDTRAVVGSFSDSRIKYHRNNRNLGLYPNFNRCIELAQGNYIAIYHNHDRYAPDIIKKCVELLDSNPDVGYVHTGTISRDPAGIDTRSYVRNWPEVCDGRWFVRRLIRRWDSPVHQPTVMARKQLYTIAGNYDHDTYGACADSAIWIQMSMLMNVGYIREPLMNITPRQPDDRYYDFNWEDVIGMARAHRLGLELLYPEKSGWNYWWDEWLRQKRVDRHFIMLLGNFIGKKQREQVAIGMKSIQKECSPSAIRLSNFLFKTGNQGSSIYRIAGSFYRGIYKLFEKNHKYS